MRAVVVGAGIAGTFTAYFLKELGLDPILIGPRPSYPLNTLIVSPLIPKEVDIVAVRESLRIYERFGKIRVVKSVNFLPGGNYGGLFKLWDKYGVRYEVLERAPEFMRNVLMKDGELVVVGDDYLVPVREILGKLRRSLKYVEGKAELVVEGERVRVRVVDRVLDADIVVLACGAWNKVVSLRAGFDLPLKYYICAAALVLGPRELGLSIGDYVNGFYSRPTGTPLDLLGLSIVGNGNFPCNNIDSAELPLDYGRYILGLVRRRFRGFIKVVKVGYSVCEASPDLMPVLGKLPYVENLYVIGGLNGYGAYVGPAAAKSLAKLITTGEGDQVARAYDISRFKTWPRDWEVLKEAHEL